jgi:predicted helicase
MKSFEYLKEEVSKIKGVSTERSYYPILKEFFIRFAAENVSTSREYNVISEASSKIYEGKVGFPDLTIQVKDYDFKTIGWVELKLPNDQLNDPKFDKQFNRYKESLENILFTNLRDWVLYQWNDKDKPHKVAECLFDAENYDEESVKNLIKLLEKFYNGKVLSLKTPKQLALALARKTRMLSQQFEDCLESDLENPEQQSDLIRLHDAFSKTLIQDIAPHQFANMLAETIAYSLFLAALEHDRKGNQVQFGLRTAIDYLPKSVPILSDMYEITSKVSGKIPEIAYAINSLIEQLKYADIHKIHNTLISHNKNKDPVLHFYEPFLAEYDPKEREERGVYYTPKPVVDYIVRSVDWILKNKFEKISGLADPDVYVLDPATGTGTFLMGAIEMLYQQKQRQFGPLGAEIVRKEFCRTVQGHILKHFFGFELMVAPYAIAHLKLTMLLEGYGFNFEQTANNNDPDDDRLQIYLTNSLEEPQKSADEEDQTSMFTFMNAISRENQKASEVKLTKPIMAIIGNPPYSNHSGNLGGYAKSLIDRYRYVDGEKIKEKGALQFEKNLQDDYVKFIAFAQKKIERTNSGVVAFITNNGFLDTPSLRGMRSDLMNSFDEIYIINLHGSSIKKEKIPGTELQDQNVFNIRQGVTISIFIKNCSINRNSGVFYFELFGSRTEKLNWLENNELQNTSWKTITPKTPNYLFIDKNLQFLEEYNAFSPLKEIFSVYGTGIITAHDDFVIDYNYNKLIERFERFKNSDRIGLYDQFNVNKKKGWSIELAWERFQNKNTEDIKGQIVPILYRPFDSRYIIYETSLLWSPVRRIMKHMLAENIGLIIPKQTKENVGGFITKSLIGHKSFSAYDINSLFPLYLYENGERISNISTEFVNKLSHDLAKTIDIDHSTQIFNYVYGILYLPKFKKKYLEHLKSDFPNIPLPSQVVKAELLTKGHSSLQEVFEKISKFGEKLRNLHLMTDSIFEDSSKWGVRIGGQKPENLEDWKVNQVKYMPAEKRVYVNQGQYFEGIDPEVWNYHIGGYQVLDKWLKDRKKAERCLDSEDLIHYLKIIVSLRETINNVNQLNQ